VVHGDHGVVLLAPFHRVCLVEPFVPCRNEVAPLADLQGLLLCRGSLRKQKRRAQRAGARSQAPCPGDLDEVPAGYSSAFLFLAHSSPALLSSACTTGLLSLPKPGNPSSVICG